MPSRWTASSPSPADAVGEPPGEVLRAPSRRGDAGAWPEGPAPRGRAGKDRTAAPQAPLPGCPVRARPSERVRAALGDDSLRPVYRCPGEHGDAHAVRAVS